MIKRILYIIYVGVRFIFFLTARKKIHIQDSDTTINDIIKYHPSISRYGDGEFDMIIRYKYGKEKASISGFQSYDEKLAKRLLEILEKGSTNNHYVCIPLWLSRGISDYKFDIQIFCMGYICKKMTYLLPLLNSSYIYYNANISRFYLSFKDKTNCPNIVSKLKKIWDKKNVCFVEGECSRLGVGNDLFDNAAKIVRILCPVRDAFCKYEKILKTIQEQLPKDTLILVALGHTATVLAYDLSILGYQALDLGHIDVEYEWMLMGAENKVKLPYKFVNEVDGGDQCTSLENEVYKSQILCHIH